MDKCKQSHLALPDSLLKRSREYGKTDDVDLELEKKMKADECLNSNLMKSKSKSMMNINGKKS